MSIADHMLTSSYGSSREAIEYRAVLRDLIGQGKFLSAVRMDIIDIRSQFGNKYDDAIVEMLAYVRTLNPRSWFQQGVDILLRDLKNLS